MALNKQFIHFQTKSAFNEQKENISDTSIAFIKETGEIYTHDKLYGSISVASTTANGLMPKEHYSIIDKESNNQFVTELSNNVSTTADKVYIQYKSRYFGNGLKHYNICNILSATSTNAGVMSATDKRKLDSLSNYTLPVADSSTLGGIKIGSGLNIDSNGTVSVDNKLYILVNSLESVSTPDANKIYLVLNSSSTSETNSFTEYVWITSDTGSKWEKLGEASATVDLANYYTKTEIDNKLSPINNSITELDNNKVDKQDVATTAKNGLLSKEDKIKLDSIETCANKYVLPEAGYNVLGGIKATTKIAGNDPGMINGTEVNVVDGVAPITYERTAEFVGANYKIIREATTTKYGLMSPEDKVKLNNINVTDFAVDLTPYAKTADVTSAIDAAKTELTGNIATAKSEAISEAKSEVATAAERLYRSKTSWANGGTITSETYYNILKGTQDSFMLPFDLNGFVSGITANGNAQRYSGVIIAVSYANTSEQPKQHSDTLYLPFAAVNAEKGVVAFEDLQFHYTDLAGTDVDVRYKVTPALNSQIKLEKVKESAGAAELPWLDVTPQSEEEFGKFVAAFIHEAGLNGKADYELNLNASTDLTQYRGIRLDLGEGNVVETPVVATVGNGFICAPAFLSDNEFVFGITKETGGKFILHIYNLSSQYVNTLSDYAKKTDIPQQPFTFYLNGDLLGYNPDDYANGINFKLQIPATISTNLNTCCKQYLERTSNAASTATSITSEDPGTKLPQFYLLFGKGNSAFRFQCDGVHQSGSALYFHGEIRNTSNYAYYDAYWMQGDSYIVFRKVLNIYFASGGAAS